MKKVLFAAVSALAVSAAIAADSTEFGVLKVPSTEAKTIVAVPWLESTTGDQDVLVSNLVLTAGLTVNDELKWYNPSTGKYQCWVLQQSGDVKYWAAVVNVNANSDSKKSEDAAKQGIARGEAIILTRSVYTDGFCIMGKPASESGVTNTLASGKNVVYSLIAPPNVDSATDVNTGMEWTNIAKTDQLTITTGNGTSKTYSRMKMSKNSNDYKWVDPNTGSDVGITIPKGQGAWFKSTTAGDKTVVWTKPVVN